MKGVKFQTHRNFPEVMNTRKKVTHTKVSNEIYLLKCVTASAIINTSRERLKKIFTISNFKLYTSSIIIINLIAFTKFNCVYYARNFRNWICTSKLIRVTKHSCWNIYLENARIVVQIKLKLKLIEEVELCALNGFNTHRIHAIDKKDVPTSFRWL